MLPELRRIATACRFRGLPVRLLEHPIHFRLQTRGIPSPIHVATFQCHVCASSNESSAQALLKDANFKRQQPNWKKKQAAGETTTNMFQDGFYSCISTYAYISRDVNTYRYGCTYINICMYITSSSGTTSPLRHLQTEKQRTPFSARAVRCPKSEKRTAAAASTVKRTEGEKHVWPEIQRMLRRARPEEEKAKHTLSSTARRRKFGHRGIGRKMMESRLLKKVSPRDLKNTLRRKSKSGRRDKTAELIGSIVEETRNSIEMHRDVISFLQVEECLQDVAHTFSHGQTFPRSGFRSGVIRTENDVYWHVANGKDGYECP